MAESVRAAVEPLHTALGEGPTIFLNASFVGLPLINQALAAENPVGPNGFLVTVRALMKVIGSIPIDAVIRARAEANRPTPPPPAPPGPQAPQGPQAPPPPASATCNVEFNLDQPGFGGIQGVRVFGGGFASEEVVIISQDGQLAALPKANTLGSYTAAISILEAETPVQHTFKAQGQTSGRKSNDAGITV